jgi:hypothetical protein
LTACLAALLFVVSCAFTGSTRTPSAIRLSDAGFHRVCAESLQTATIKRALLSSGIPDERQLILARFAGRPFHPAATAIRAARAHRCASGRPSGQQARRR